MSNVLAVAAVTRLLKDLLNDTLINNDISGNVGQDVVVSAVPPDRALALTGEEAPSRLNLFLHRITTNPALAAADLPTRDARGGLVARPRLALDLHYLLSAYTLDEFHAEILLGYAMLLFHETPILGRAQVRAALAGGPNGAILPPAFAGTDPARLADQIELIKITPQPLSLDDMSKLWTALQSNYRTSVAYQVSVVLIERERPARAALPVLSRGPPDPVSGRDAGVAVRTGLTPAFPVLARIEPVAGRPTPRLGDRLTLAGFALDEGEARVRFTPAEGGAALELGPAGPATPQRLMVELPAGPALPAGHPLAGTGYDPGQWRVGPYLVEVALSAGGRIRTTNRIPFTLAPLVTPAAAADPGGTRISVGVAPRIRAGQPASLLAGQAEAVLPPPAADTDVVEAVFPDLVPGATVPVRLRVAGIDSVLIDPAATPPAFDPTQLVAVP
jgi:hypothetical protein